MVALSMNSSVQGTTCAAMIPATACEARFTSGKMAIMALEALGGVTSLRTALLVSASVPSEATSSSVRL